MVGMARRNSTSCLISGLQKHIAIGRYEDGMGKGYKSEARRRNKDGIGECHDDTIDEKDGSEMP